MHTRTENLTFLRCSTHLLHFLVEDVLHDLAQVLELGLVLLVLLLFLLIFWQLKTFLGHRHEGLS